MHTFSLFLDVYILMQFISRRTNERTNEQTKIVLFKSNKTNCTYVEWIWMFISLFGWVNQLNPFAKDWNVSETWWFSFRIRLSGNFTRIVALFTTNALQYHNRAVGRNKGTNNLNFAKQQRKWNKNTNTKLAMRLTGSESVAKKERWSEKQHQNR